MSREGDIQSDCMKRDTTTFTTSAFILKEESKNKNKIKIETRTKEQRQRGKRVPLKGQGNKRKSGRNGPAIAKCVRPDKGEERG